MVMRGCVVLSSIWHFVATVVCFIPPVQCARCIVCAGMHSWVVNMLYAHFVLYWAWFLRAVPPYFGVGFLVYACMGYLPIRRVNSSSARVFPALLFLLERFWRWIMSQSVSHIAFVVRTQSWARYELVLPTWHRPPYDSRVPLVGSRDPPCRYLVSWRVVLFSGSGIWFGHFGGSRRGGALTIWFSAIGACSFSM